MTNFGLIKKGTTGDCTWTLENEVLTISGNGKMGDGRPCNAKIEKVVIEDGVTSIGSNAFMYYENLTSIAIPDSVTSIGDEAFAFCYGLTSITIPDSVTSIGSAAFFDCKSITSITIPDSVTEIGIMSFWLCTSLTSAKIPDNVTSIGREAFLHCKSLTSITIGKGVTSIGKDAFLGCKNLTIRAYEGSYAETYAQKNGIKYMVMPQKSHVTTCYVEGMPTEQAKKIIREYIPFIGKKVPVMAYAHGNDGINEGLAVEIDPSSKVPYYGAKVPHITLAVNKNQGGKAVNTAYLNFSRRNFTPFIITGKIGFFMEDGTIAYSIEDTFERGNVVYVGLFFDKETLHNMSPDKTNKERRVAVELTKKDIIAKYPVFAEVSEHRITMIRKGIVTENYTSDHPKFQEMVKLLERFNLKKIKLVGSTLHIFVEA